ncbi:MAG: GyrI-like domain-containing protein [Alphaproteobacteria bacterium]
MLGTPIIRTHGPLNLIGITDRQVFGERSTAADQWGAFGARAHEIPHALPDSYGVCRQPADGSTGFIYLVAQQVTTIDQVPAGMTTDQIQARPYAVFTHNGDVSTIDATCAAIDEDWRPHTDFQIDTDCDLILIEHYGPLFNPVTLSGDIEIWVPLIG